MAHPMPTTSQRRSKLSWALAVLPLLAASAHADAPGSVFGSPPPSQQFQPPPAQTAPVTPFKKTQPGTPDWGGATGTQAPSANAQTVAPGVLSPKSSATHGGTVPGQNRPTNKLAVKPQAPQRVLSKQSPRRAVLLQAQAKIRDDENRIALALRGSGAKAAAPVVSIPNAPQAKENSTAASIEARVRAPTSVARAGTQDELAKMPTGIWSINNKTSGFVVTPGGNVVILGKGFGQTRGDVLVKNLTGFAGNTLGLQVASWGNYEIDASLPANIRNLPDLNGISVEVVPPGGKPFALANGKFVAAREEIELPAQSDLHRIFDFTPSPNPGATMSQQSCVYSVPFSNNGGVCRVHQPPCFAPAIDVYYPKSLPNGFIVTAFSLVPSTPTDSGNGDGFGYSGNHVFTPGYEIVSWGDAKTAVGPNRDKTVEAIQIRWGVLRSHNTDSIPFDDCTSEYDIFAIYVTGPAGLTPF